MCWVDEMIASSVRGAQRPWESFIPNWFFSHLLPPSCEPEYGRKTSGPVAYVWFFLIFLFCLFMGAGGWHIYMTFHSNLLYGSLYWLRMHEDLWDTSTMQCVHTQCAWPQGLDSQGLPAPAALAQTEGLCYFLKALLGRFPSLSWQHSLMSNNPPHQETVFPFFKINTLRLHFTVLLFLCNQRGWEELVRHFLTLNKHSYPQKSLINGPSAFSTLSWAFLLSLLSKFLLTMFYVVAFPHNPHWILCVPTWSWK